MEQFLALLPCSKKVLGLNPSLGSHCMAFACSLLSMCRFFVGTPASFHSFWTVGEEYIFWKRVNGCPFLGTCHPVYLRWRKALAPPAALQCQASIDMHSWMDVLRYLADVVGITLGLEELWSIRRQRVLLMDFLKTSLVEQLCGQKAVRTQINIKKYTEKSQNNSEFSGRWTHITPLKLVDFSLQHYGMVVYRCEWNRVWGLSVFSLQGQTEV